MAEVLSQNEIDALLKNVSAEKPKQDENEIDKETTYLYDFKHPNRVTKDQLRNLRTIHESFSRMLATYLTTLLRTIVDVNLLSIDQVTFLEFTMAMSNPGCIWIFKLDNYEGKGIVEVSPDLMLLTIERLFGGEGKQGSETRSLSIIEQNVAGKIIDRCLDIYDEAWVKATTLQTSMVGFEMNPQFAQVAPASETAVVMFLEISVRNTTFPMNICFPYFVLDPIIQKLSADNWLGFSLMSKTDLDHQRAHYSLTHSNVNLKVDLGSTTISVEELLELEKDDVLVLDTKVSQPLKIYVGDKVRFLGTAGKADKKLAVRVDDVIEEDGLVESSTDALQDAAANTKAVAQ